MKTRSVLLIGGPDMGKTNFLARFWGAVYHSKTGCLRYDGLPDDLDHLNSILGELLAGKFVGRTSGEEHWHCEIPLHAADAQKFRGNLIVPDCSGEEWRRIYKNHEWSSRWEDLIERVWGCLVFLRPTSDEMRAPLDWMACWKYLGAPVQDQKAEDEAPSQVEMVDWLQCLRLAHYARVGGSFRLRVGVVVAAWDALPADKRGMTPDRYLEENAPLLHQFMRTNGHAYEFAAFGVSVAGGDFELDEDFKQEYQRGNPYDAGYVIHDLSGERRESPDHTLPVAWAMGLNVASPPDQGSGS